jgi:hypothetical protein
MPGSRPDAAALLAVLRQYLETDLPPLLPDYHKFQLRIAGRLLAMLEREVTEGVAMDAAELERLRQLLGRDGSLADLNTMLAQAIRDGAMDLDDAALQNYLRQSLADALRINNPKWLQ